MSTKTPIEWTRSTFGSRPAAPRDGDKVQARQRINVLVRTGRLAHPNERPCVGCGHVWQPGERRHEYDHHRGYDAEHHYDVEPVCTLCHAERDSAKVKQTHCVHGHEFTADNTGRKPNNTRFCRQCRRAYDGRRRDAKWWRDYRARREARGKGN